MGMRRGLSVGLLACLACICPAYGLTINYIWTGSGTETAQEKAAFGGVSYMYATLFQDPITVNIDVGFSSLAGTVVAESNFTMAFINPVGGNTPYDELLGALEADAKTPDDFTALASLPVTPPSQFGTKTVLLSTANANALGANLSGYGVDGTITFNSTLSGGDSFYYRGYGSIASNQYDFWAELMHETDEVLGTVSILSFKLNNGMPADTAYFMPADLFRYDGVGSRSLTLSSSDNAYLSINGGRTDLANYNQTGTGDYGDFKTNCSTPLVQDAGGCLGKIINLSQPEIALLDAVGYDATPEPATLTLVACGAVLALRRRRSR